MANFTYLHAKHLIMTGVLDVEAAAAAGHLKAILVMTNTTLDTQTEASALSGVTTLDECDGATYARQTLTGTAVAKDVPNYRSKLTAANPTFGSPGLGASTRPVQACVILFDTGGGAGTEIPFLWIDQDDFPFTPASEPKTIVFSANGVTRL